MPGIAHAPVRGPWAAAGCFILHASVVAQLEKAVEARKVGMRSIGTVRVSRQRTLASGTERLAPARSSAAAAARWPRASARCRAVLHAARAHLNLQRHGMVKHHSSLALRTSLTPPPGRPQPPYSPAVPPARTGRRATPARVTHSIPLLSAWCYRWQLLWCYSWAWALQAGTRSGAHAHREVKRGALLGDVPDERNKGSRSASGLCT